MIDLAEGRRLLDASYESSDEWVRWRNWCIYDDNAEVMLTLLEQAREVLSEVEWEGADSTCPSCGSARWQGHMEVCRLVAALLPLGEATDAGDPLSLLELENLP